MGKKLPPSEENLTIVLDGDSEKDCYRLWVNPSSQVYSKINFGEFSRSRFDSFFHLKPGRYLVKNCRYLCYARFKRTITKFSDDEIENIEKVMKAESSSSGSDQRLSSVKTWTSSWSKECGQAGGSSKTLKDGIFIGLSANPQILIQLDTDSKIKLHLFKFTRCNNFGTGLQLFRVENVNSATSGFTLEREVINAAEPVAVGVGTATDEKDSNQFVIEVDHLKKGNYICIPHAKTHEEANFILRLQQTKI